MQPRALKAIAECPKEARRRADRVVWFARRKTQRRRSRSMATIKEFCRTIDEASTPFVAIKPRMRALDAGS